MNNRLVTSRVVLSDKAIVVLIAFAVFTLTVAFRDILFRYMMVNGEALSSMCFFTGLFGLLSSFALVRKLSDFKLKNRKMQLYRFFMSCGTGFLIIKVFQLLSPSFVAIVTKSGIPIVVLLGGMFGYTYTTKEKMYSLVVIALISSFSFIGVSGEISKLGLFLLVISIFFTVGEYLFISHAVRNENKFYLSATPSFALLFVGLILMPFEVEKMLEISLFSVCLLFLCGILYFAAYYTSIVRYKYLPPGLAEYPSLLTYFVILPFELLVFRKEFQFNVFINAVLVLVGMSVLLKARIKGGKGGSE